MSEEEIISAVRGYGEGREEIEWKYIMQVCSNVEICEAAAGSVTPEEAIEKVHSVAVVSARVLLRQ